jgi:membrane fusion protein, multidrug efflux system
MSYANGRFLVPSLLAAALLAGCSAGAEKASLPERPAEAANVGVRVIQPQTELNGGLVKATGRLRARNEANLGPKASGSIAALLVDVGDTVKKGDAMMRLDATSASIAVEQASAAVAVAEANLAVAEQDVERARQLSASGGVSPAGLEKAEAGYTQAQAGLKQAKAQLRNAQKHLADHTLRAPFDGVVTARMKNLGEFVGNMPATPVYGLVDTDSLEVVLPVPETVVGAIKPGSIVRGVVNPAGKPFEAKVRTVGSVVDAARTVEVRADLVGERSEAMRPNAIVEVDFSANEAVSGLFLPAQAVRKDGDKRFVWVVAEGKVARQEIQAEAMTPGVVRVLGGIDGGAQVVADGGVSLADGMAVQVIQ